MTSTCDPIPQFSCLRSYYSNLGIHAHLVPQIPALLEINKIPKKLLPMPSAAPRISANLGAT